MLQSIARYKMLSLTLLCLCIVNTYANPSFLSHQSSLQPRASDPSILLANAQEAQKLNAKFTSMTMDTACKTGDMACIAGAFSQCVNGKFLGSPCAGGLKCFAMPLVLKKGTTLGCNTEADTIARITQAGASGGLTGDASATASKPEPSSTTSSTPAPPNASGNMDTDDTTTGGMNNQPSSKKADKKSSTKDSKSSDKTQDVEDDDDADS
ncbi:hypothetical protein O181_002545 [Austropuccinia psidii MF-1]|uniref:Carbohydrate-binding module family 19 domain-containing protein n=1 Tax=Austropuccinia psidii MF-1 TaxID=1389203 RepID=A0A9Q3BCN5_9BASI|nr:hypothetical protein [Austropuccinia psidii MF-1]